MIIVLFSPSPIHNTQGKLSIQPKNKNKPIDQRLPQGLLPESWLIVEDESSQVGLFGGRPEKKKGEGIM